MYLDQLSAAIFDYKLKTRTINGFLPYSQSELQTKVLTVVNDVFEDYHSKKDFSDSSFYEYLSILDSLCQLSTCFEDEREKNFCTLEAMILAHRSFLGLDHKSLEEASRIRSSIRIAA